MSPAIDLSGATRTEGRLNKESVNEFCIVEVVAMHGLPARRRCRLGYPSSPLRVARENLLDVAVFQVKWLQHVLASLESRTSRTGGLHW
jgi:hypothetical protein